MATAWLTPAFDTGAVLNGKVHSVFERVVNLAFDLNGEPRLFALCAPGLPRLPDAARVPEAWLAALSPGQPALFRRERLTVGNASLPLTAETWRGEIPLYQNKPDLKRLDALRLSGPGGFDRLPEALRIQAFHAVRAGDGRTLIGLGAGLTPAFDDACVGAMAARRALGDSRPFLLPDLGVTSDISRRYLTLAREGFFGEPLCELITALFDEGDLLRAADRLLAVGATSGWDMLTGVRLTLDDAWNPTAPP